MTIDDQIAHALYESMDRMKVQDHRRSVFDFAVKARRARRKGDIGAVLSNYKHVIGEIERSSDDRAYQALPIVREEVLRLEYQNG